MSDQVVNALANRRLNSRDRRLVESMGDTRYNQRADMATELSQGNLIELQQAIDAQRDPQLKAVLMGEMENLRQQMGSLAGPIKMPEPLPGMIEDNPIHQVPYSAPRLNPKVRM